MATTTTDRRLKAPTAATTGSLQGTGSNGMEILRNLLDLYGRDASELSIKEKKEAITGYELKQRIEALVRAITGTAIKHIYAGSGAATAPGMMLLPRIASTLLFSPREVGIILGYTAHELSHQLHTDFDLVLKLFADIENPTTREQQVKEFWNGIEDYRIERESRRRYPGFPVLINETRDHTARRFVDQVDKGMVPPEALTNPYRIGSVALTWIGARLNNYRTSAPDEALLRIPEPLRGWLQSWDGEMAAIVTCDDARILAERILDEIDRMRENPPEDSEDKDKDQNKPQDDDRDPNEDGEGDGGDGDSEGAKSGGENGSSRGDEPGDDADEPDESAETDDAGKTNGSDDADENESDEGSGASEDDEGEGGRKDDSSDQEGGGKSDPEDGSEKDDGDATGDDRTEGGGEDSADDEGNENSGAEDGKDAGDESDDVDDRSDATADGGGTGADGENGDAEEDGEAKPGEGKADGKPDGGEDAKESDPTASDGNEEGDETENSGDAEDDGASAGNGAGSNAPKKQKDGGSAERQDIHVNEGDQHEKAEEADLAIDELLEAINEACKGRREAECPEVVDTEAVAEAKSDEYEDDEDDGEEGEEGIEHSRVPLTGIEKYTRLRQEIGSAAARSAGVVRRLLQSRNRTRHRTGREDGHLDFNRLVPMALGSNDVYRDTRSTPQINTALSLLLDNSGSMGGHPLVVCQKTAIVLDMAVQGTPTALEITGFTSANRGTRIYQYRTFEQKSVSSSASLGNMDAVELGGTPVATPIMEAWRRLKQRKEPRKIMIVVSDGGAEDPVDARAAAEIVELQGGVVIGIAIGAEIYMKKWCDKVIPINDIEELPQALTSIVQEYLSR